MEQVLMKSLQRGGAAGAEADDIVLEPSLAERLQRAMNEAARRGSAGQGAGAAGAGAAARGAGALHAPHQSRDPGHLVPGNSRQQAGDDRGNRRLTNSDRRPRGRHRGRARRHGTEANHRPGREDGVAARARAARSRRHDPVEPARRRGRRDRRRAGSASCPRAAGVAHERGGTDAAGVRPGGGGCTRGAAAAPAGAGSAHSPAWRTRYRQPPAQRQLLRRRRSQPRALRLAKGRRWRRSGWRCNRSCAACARCWRSA